MAAVPPPRPHPAPRARRQTPTAVPRRARRPDAVRLDGAGDVPAEDRVEDRTGVVDEQRAAGDHRPLAETLEVRRQVGVHARMRRLERVERMADAEDGADAAGRPYDVEERRQVTVSEADGRVHPEDGRVVRQRLLQNKFGNSEANEYLIVVL